MDANAPLVSLRPMPSLETLLEENDVAYAVLERPSPAIEPKTPGGRDGDPSGRPRSGGRGLRALPLTQHVCVLRVSVRA